MLPAFKEGRYAVGVSGAVDALSSIIRKSPEAAEYSMVNDSKRGSTSSSGAGFGWIFFLVIIVLNVLSQLLGKTKSWWLGGVIGAFVGGIIGLIWGFFNAGIIAIPILVVLGLLFDFIVSKHPPRSGWLCSEVSKKEIENTFKYAAIHYEHNRGLQWKIPTLFGHDGIQQENIGIHNVSDKHPEGMIMYTSHIAGSWNHNVWNKTNYEQLRLSLSHLVEQYQCEFKTLSECIN
jgi:hypothetical protein